MRIAETAAFLYTIPTFQNPSGRTMSAERRKRIVELADVYDLLVVEDDPYGLIRYEGEPEPSLFELTGRTCVYSSSFSKTISPGLRVGWYIFPEELAAELTEDAASTYITPVLLNQAIAHEFVRRGNFEPNLERVNGLLKARRDAMLSALDRHLSGCTWTHPRAATSSGSSSRRARSRRTCSRRQRASHSCPASTAAVCRTPHDSRTASSRPKRSTSASSGSPPRSSTRRRRRRLPRAGGHRQRAGDERRLLRRLQRPAGGAEGRAGSLDRQGAETVAAEVAVLAGLSLGAHAAGVPRRSLGRGLANADPRDSAARVNGLPSKKTRSFRPFRRAPKTAPVLRLPQRCQGLQRLLKTLHRDDAQGSAAYLRASAAFSPAGTRKSVHTRLARADTSSA